MKEILYKLEFGKETIKMYTKTCYQEYQVNKWCMCSESFNSFTYRIVVEDNHDINKLIVEIRNIIREKLERQIESTNKSLDAINGIAVVTVKEWIWKLISKRKLKNVETVHFYITIMDNLVFTIV